MTAAVIALGISGSAATVGAVSERGTTGSASEPVSRLTAVVDNRAPRSETCPDHRKGLAFYRQRHARWLKMRGAEPRERHLRAPRNCADAGYLAKVWRTRSFYARMRYEEWRHYHYDWRAWLPDKWQRIGACETGYGRRPGQWTWNSGTYQGAFGFYHGSWDAFVSSADPKAGPYPSEAYLATPRQQYEVALAIYRRFGFSGWGCRGA